MGNEQARPLAKKRNQSFDVGDFRNLDKILPSNGSLSAMDVAKYSVILGTSNNGKQTKMNNSISAHEMPTIGSQSSLKPKLSIKQQNAKLQKLTKTNDELRKQLMQINKKLTEQLQKKKIPSLMPTHLDKSPDKLSKNNSKSHQPIDKLKTASLKRELQNAYSQVLTYKKQIQFLKKNDSHQNDMKLQTFEDKAISIESEIANVQKSIESLRAIVSKQKSDIKEYEAELEGEELQETKREIVMLKERLKKVKEVGRKKEKEEKVRHELLIQMERKLRQTNEQYVPELRNWSIQEPSNKSRIIPANKPQKKKSPSPTPKPFRYMPSNLQLEEAETQLKQQKLAHEEFHKRIDLELRKRNEYREERFRIQQQLQVLYKNLENLQYKKERYVQLIMGSDTFVEEMADEMLSIGEQEVVGDGDIVVKGENLQGQIQFSDSKTIPNYQKVLHKLKIVTLNTWTSEKGHIIALQSYYTDGDSFFVGKKSAEPTANTEKHTLELSQGDYLRNVMGIFNSKTKFLELIVFQSLKGKVLKVGKESFKNNNFNLRIGKGQRPALVSGACVQDVTGWRINRLDFVIKGG